MFYIYIVIFILLLVSLYILSIKPNKKRNIDFLLGRYYSHRGIHDNKDAHPENSLSSFKLALEKDYGIELDVQVTKDNIPVIFHDNILLRACNLNTKIGDYSLAELRELKLFKTEEFIPTLKEVLNLINAKVPLIVEIKNDSSDVSDIKYIAEVLDAYKGDYVVESFNPLAVLWYKKNRPLIIRGQLSSSFKRSHHSFTRRFRDFLLENLMTNFLTKPDFIAFNHKYKNMFGFRLCKKIFNPLTIAYTIKSEEELKENLRDFDLFIFDSFIPKDTN